MTLMTVYADHNVTIFTKCFAWTLVTNGLGVVQFLSFVAVQLVLLRHGRDRSYRTVSRVPQGPYTL